MKKIISIILCMIYLHMQLPVWVLSEDNSVNECAQNQQNSNVNVHTAELSSTSLLIDDEISSQTPINPLGLGTEDDPYLISSIDNLQWLSLQSRTNPFTNVFFKQTTSLDTSSITSWNQIGNKSQPFFGIYDGNGNSIHINGKHMQIFGYNYGTIKNLILDINLVQIEYNTYSEGFGVLAFSNTGTISNCSIRGSLIITMSTNISYGKIGCFLAENRGTISGCFSSVDTEIKVLEESADNTDAGYCSFVRDNSGFITNCFTTGNINLTSNNASPLSCYSYLAGLNLYNSESGKISDCYSTGNILINGGDFINEQSSDCQIYTGGLILDNYGDISNCHVTGNINGYRAGGLVYGNWGGKILSSYTAGRVTGDVAGGLVIYNAFEPAWIYDCYSKSTITGYFAAAGLAGENGDKALISNSYASGMVMSFKSFGGGLVAYNYGNISNSYSMGIVSCPFGKANEKVGPSKFLTGYDEYNRPIYKYENIGYLVGNCGLSGTISNSSFYPPATTPDPGKPTPSPCKAIVTDVSCKYYTTNGSGSSKIFLNGINFSLQFSASVDWKGETPGDVLFKTPYRTITATNSEGKYYANLNMGSDFGDGGRLTVVAVTKGNNSSVPLDGGLEVAPIPVGLNNCTITDVENSNFKYDASLKIEDSQGKKFTLPSKNPGLKSIDLTCIPTFTLSMQDGNLEIEFKGFAGSLVSTQNDEVIQKVIDAIQNKCYNKIDTEKKMGMTSKTKIRGGYNLALHHWDYSGQFSVGAEASLDATGRFLLGTVPAYLSGEVSAELDLAAKYDNSKISFGMETNDSLEGRAGLGVRNLLSGELFINGSVSASTLNSPYVTWSLKGAGRVLVLSLISLDSPSIFKASASYTDSGWTYSSYYMWDKFIRKKQNMSLMQSSISTESAPTTNLFEAPQFSTIERNYTMGTNSWSVANSLKHKTLLSSLTDNTPVAVNTYPYSDSKLTPLDNGYMMTYLLDNPNRSAANGTQLYYAIYNGGNWSSPLPIMADDGMIDNNPVLSSDELKSDESKVFAAWEHMNTVIPDNDDYTIDDLSQIYSESEISVGVYNGSSWTTQTITNNSVMDCVPQIASNNGNAFVIWNENDANDIFGTSGTYDKIMYSKYDGANWSEPQLLAQCPGYIVKSSINCDGNNAMLACTVDTDGDFSTTEDQRLFVATYNNGWSALQTISNDTTMDANPQVINTSTGLAVYYYNSGNLMCYNGESITSVMNSAPSSEYKLLQNGNVPTAIIYGGGKGNAQEVFGAFYDSTLNTWGNGVPLTSFGGLCDGIDACLDKDERVIISFNESMPKMEGTGETTQYVRGQTDLYVMPVYLASKVEIVADSLSCNPYNPAPNTQATISAQIINNGQSTASDSIVSFYNGDPAMGGVFIDSVTVTELASGNAQDVQVQWSVPPGWNSNDIYVVSGDNKAHNVFGMADVNIVSFNAYINDDALNTTVNIVNSGYIPASGINVVLRTGGENGNVLSTKTVNTLNPSASENLTFNFNNAITLLGNEAMLYVEVSSVGNDANLNNNSYLVALDNIVSTQLDPVLENFSISILKNSWYIGTLNVTNTSNGVVSYAPVTQPTNGRLGLNSDGTFTYIPNQEFTGNDYFSYNVYSSNELKGTVNVTMQVSDVKNVCFDGIYNDVLPLGDGHIFTADCSNSIESATAILAIYDGTRLSKIYKSSVIDGKIQITNVSIPDSQEVKSKLIITKELNTLTPLMTSVSINKRAYLNSIKNAVLFDEQELCKLPNTPTSTVSSQFTPDFEGSTFVINIYSSGNIYKTFSSQIINGAISIPIDLPAGDDTTTTFMILKDTSSSELLTLPVTLTR